MIREVSDLNNRQQVYAVVSELGGRVGSLSPPIPFTGSEIRISFRELELTNDELKRLTVIQSIASRNHVSVAFIDTNVSAADISDLREAIPNCRVFRIVDGDYPNEQ